MKHDWTDEELLEHWTLSETELPLLANKTEIGRLGFAVLLKFFSLTARLPRQAAQVVRGTRSCRFRPSEDGQGVRRGL